MASASLNGGVPLSVTRTTTVLVPAGKPVVGQVNRPVTGLMLAPAGAPASRLKVKICGGWSASPAAAVKLMTCPRCTERFPIGDSTGGVLAPTRFGARGVGAGRNTMLGLPS